MKKSIIILILGIQFLNCKAQNPIVPIQNQGGIDYAIGTYFKDTNNYLNPFVGTWKYTNGTTSLKFVIQKIIMSHNGFEYNDLLIGQYEYIENGVIKTSTLSEIGMVFPDMRNHSLEGNSIYKGANQGPKCSECNSSTIRVHLGLDERIKRIYSDIYAFVTYDAQGTEVMKVSIYGDGKAFANPNSTVINPIDISTKIPVGNNIPNGRYTLIKQ
jgi:hypothetical protein